MNNCWTIELLAIVLLCTQAVHCLKETQCEVCFGVINKLKAKIEDMPSGERTVPSKIENVFRDMCLNMKKAENRFCYYIGGLEESATKILGELSRPVSYGLPTDKVCERLVKKDSQICELRYEKTIDLKTVDLKKLRVRDLKKVLSDWDESCDGCVEKSEFIKRIEELKHKYVKEEKEEL